MSSSSAKACRGLEPRMWNGDVQTSHVYVVQDRAEGSSHTHVTGMFIHARCTLCKGVRRA